MAEAEQRTKRADNRRDRTDQRNASGEEPAEDHEHHRERDRQRDRLTALQVPLGDRDDRFNEEARRSNLNRCVGKLDAQRVASFREGLNDRIHLFRIKLFTVGTRHPHDVEHATPILRKQWCYRRKPGAVWTEWNREGIEDRHRVIRQLIDEVRADRRDVGFVEVDSVHEQRRRFRTRAVVVASQDVVGARTLTRRGRGPADQTIEQRLAGDSADRSCHGSANDERPRDKSDPRPLAEERRDAPEH